MVMKITQNKKCIVCNIVKDVTEFDLRNNSKDGYNNKCKKCKSNYNKKYYKNNKDRLTASCKEYDQKHKKEKTQYNKEYYEKNKETLISKNKNYRQSHKQEISTKSKEYLRNRYNIDEQYRNYKNLKRRVQLAFAKFSANGKIMQSKQYGIDYTAILEHLGPCPGPRKNYNIDHIFPLAAFNFDDPEQIKLAFAPENHQWLTKEENLAKSDNYDIEAFKKYVGEK